MPEMGQRRGFRFFSGPFQDRSLRDRVLQGRSLRFLSIFFAGFLILASAVVSTSGAGAPDQDIVFFRIGTGATSGTYFPIGGLLASAISNPPGSRACKSGGSCGVPGLIAVAQSTEGSVENIEMMTSGELDSGLSQADVAFWAYRGEKMFRGKLAPGEKKGGKPLGVNLRAIANLFPESVHLVVREESKISSVADLKGKRVSLGEPESGTLASATLVLNGFGLNKSRLKPFYLTPGEAADKLRAGEIDAFFLVAGAPVRAIVDLASEIPVSLVAISGKKADKIRKSDSFFVETVIPGGAYEGVDATKTLSVGAQWLVRADLSDDLVYGITRALWDPNIHKLLADGHPLGKMIRPETALDGLGIPLHPGAERYYKEKGLLLLGGG